MKALYIMILIAAILCPVSARAEYQNGFNEGPYLRLIGGFLQSTFDNNARTGRQLAADYQGTLGIQFGWYLWDPFATELEIRYATTKEGSSREHIVNANMNVKYNFITNSLTGVGDHFDIMPFVQGGPAVLLAAVPGDTLATNDIMGVYGGGVGGGVGVDVLVIGHIFFGVLLQCDVIWVTPIDQTIGGVQQRIVGGGWEPFLSGLGTLGVHF